MDNRANRIWTVAGVIAVVAFIVLKWLAGYSFFPALLLAVLVLLLAALLLWILWDHEPADRTQVSVGSSASGRNVAAATGAASVPASRTAKALDSGTQSGVSTETGTQKDTGAVQAAKLASLPDDPSTEDEIAADEDMIAAGDTDFEPVDQFMDEGLSADDYKRYAAIDDAEEVAEDTGDALAPEDDNPDVGAPETPETIRTVKAPRRETVRPGGRTGRPSGSGDPRPAPRRGKKAESANVADPAAKTGAGPKPAAAKPKSRKGKTGAGADDLKQIKGVGPKLERDLHALGITTFAQIAAFTAADVARIGEALKFGGRMERDGWIDQARILAAGGETEFSGRVKKGDVY